MNYTMVREDLQRLFDKMTKTFLRYCKKYKLPVKGIGFTDVVGERKIQVLPEGKTCIEVVKKVCCQWGGFGGNDENTSAQATGQTMAVSPLPSGWEAGDWV